MGNNLLQAEKLEVKAVDNTVEGGSLSESCCDQQIIKAEKGHPAIPIESLVFAPLFIHDSIQILSHQYKVTLREHFNNKGFTETENKNKKTTTHSQNPNLNGNKIPGPQDTLEAEKRATLCSTWLLLTTKS